jgi:hypothetical protein
MNKVYTPLPIDIEGQTTPVRQSNCGKYCKKFLAVIAALIAMNIAVCLLTDYDYNANNIINDECRIVYANAENMTVAYSWPLYTVSQCLNIEQFHQDSQFEQYQPGDITVCHYDDTNHCPTLILGEFYYNLAGYTLLTIASMLIVIMSCAIVAV